MLWYFGPIDLKTTNNNEFTEIWEGKIEWQFAYQERRSKIENQTVWFDYAMVKHEVYSQRIRDYFGVSYRQNVPIIDPGLIKHLLVIFTRHAIRTELGDHVFHAIFHHVLPFVGMLIVHRDDDIFEYAH